MEEGLLEKEERRGRRKCCDFTDEARRLGYLAGPMIGVTLSLYLVQVISSMMVGHLGELALASSAIATSLSGVTGFSLLADESPRRVSEEAEKTEVEQPTKPKEQRNKEAKRMKEYIEGENFFWGSDTILCEMLLPTSQWKLYLKQRQF